MARWPDRTPFERFETKFDKVDGCWMWKGAPKKTGGGYAQFYYRGTYELAHRMSWAFYRNRGELPRGACVLHKCDVRLCVNPNHLFLGTQQDNVADMVSKGRHGATHLPPWTKLTPEIVREIRALKGTAPGIRIGKQFGLSHSYVQSIWQQKVWKHVVC